MNFILIGNGLLAGKKRRSESLLVVDMTPFYRRSWEDVAAFHSLEWNSIIGGLLLNDVDASNRGASASSANSTI